MITYLLIIAGLLFIDQLTKTIVMRNMDLYQSIEIIPNFFSFTSHRNTGAAWSMMEGRMVFFYIITIIAVSIFLYFLIKDGDIVNKKVYTYSLLFIIAGALGNFIDRLIYKEVVDFLDFVIFKYNFPVFNVADILLTLGTIGFGFAVVILNE
jgi:signal peptidase II